MKKDLTKTLKESKLQIYEVEKKLEKKTGRVIVVIDFNQGGITNLEEFERIS